MPEATFMNVVLSMNALEDEERPNPDETDEDDDLLIDLELFVEPVQGHPTRFRMCEPVTLFGVTPLLNMGDVIEIQESEEHGLLVTGLVERGDPWTRDVGLLRGSFDTLREEPLGSLLDQFIDLGGMWEVSTRYVKLQFPLTDGEEDPRGDVLELARRIESALADQRDQPFAMDRNQVPSKFGAQVASPIKVRLGNRSS